MLLKQIIVYLQNLPILFLELIDNGGKFIDFFQNEYSRINKNLLTFSLIFCLIRFKHIFVIKNFYVVSNLIFNEIHRFSQIITAKHYFITTTIALIAIFFKGIPILKR